MKFPFSISKTIYFRQPVKKITTERYLLNQIEDKLAEWRMMTMHKSDNEIFLEKVNLLKSHRIKDNLHNLSVKVETDQVKIKVTVKSNTTLIFLIGIFPYLMFFLPNQDVPLLVMAIPSLLAWGIGYLVRSLVLTEVKYDIYEHLKKENGF